MEQFRKFLRDKAFALVLTACLLAAAAAGVWPAGRSPGQPTPPARPGWPGRRQRSRCVSWRPPWGGFGYYRYYSMGGKRIVWRRVRRQSQKPRRCSSAAPSPSRQSQKPRRKAAAPKGRAAAFTFPVYNRIIYEICLSFCGWAAQFPEGNDP